MFYIVYQVTNNINGKIYIGAHKTDKLDDGYMGSGKHLKRAIAKYGISAFSKQILDVFDNVEDMFRMESVVVNENFILQKTNYNLRVGGSGGFTREEASKGRQRTNLLLQEKYGNDWRKLVAIKGNVKCHEILAQKRADDPKFGRFSEEDSAKGRQAAMSEKSRQKRIATMRLRGHNQGEKSSQFGTCWIYNLETLENKKIKKDGIIPSGWVKGRKIKKREG
jgi:hypothetical protein